MKSSSCYICEIETMIHVINTPLDTIYKVRAKYYYCIKGALALVVLVSFSGYVC